MLLLDGPDASLGSFFFDTVDSYGAHAQTLLIHSARRPPDAHSRYQRDVWSERGVRARRRLPSWIPFKAVTLL
jgi:hypothetical protein